MREGRKGKMDTVSKKQGKYNAHILKSKWIVNHLVHKSIKHLLKVRNYQRRLKTHRIIYLYINEDDFKS